MKYLVELLSLISLWYLLKALYKYIVRRRYRNCLKKIDSWLLLFTSDERTNVTKRDEPTFFLYELMLDGERFFMFEIYHPQGTYAMMRLHLGNRSHITMTWYHQGNVDEALSAAGAYLRVQWKSRGVLSGL